MERFEYQHKDIPMLKKDIFFRFLFMLIFVGIFAWQLVLLISNNIKGTLTPTKTMFSLALLVFALLFAVVSFTYAFRSLNILQKVILNGSAVRNISILSNINKNSFLKIYSFINLLIALIMLAVLCCAITYSVLQYVYFTTISYYMPILLFVTVAGFNSVYHIKTEIKTIQNVREFNNVF